MLFLPNLKVVDIGWCVHTAVHRQGMEVVAHQGGIAVEGDGLVLHLQGFECAGMGFQVGNELRLVLHLAAGVAVGELVGRQCMKLLEVQVQHGLGQLIDCLGYILLGGAGRGGDVAAEQAQKSDQHFEVGHGCFLIVVKKYDEVRRRTTMQYSQGGRKVKFCRSLR